MFKRGILLVVFCTLLSGCKEQTIRILTVEFHSGAVVPNVTVTLMDAETEKVLETKTSDEEGEVTFSKLTPNRTYVVSNVSETAAGFVDSTTFTYEEDMAYFLFETHFSHNVQGLAVPLVEPPSNMKSAQALTALASVLQYYGVNVSVEEVYEAFTKQPFTYEQNKRIGGNPRQVFVGDAYEQESYVYADALAEVAVTLIEAHDAPLFVFDATSSTKEELLQMIESGVPVIAWVTNSLHAPQMTSWQLNDAGTLFWAAQNSEPVVIIGEMLQQLHVISASTRKTYDVDTFYDMFTQLGSQAVVIRK